MLHFPLVCAIPSMATDGARRHCTCLAHAGHHRHEPL